MSDILDALRKAELQRSAPAVPGISTRQRYLTPRRRSWPYPLLIGSALVLGAVLMGGVAAYLAHERSAPLPVAQVDAKQAVPDGKEPSGERVAQSHQPAPVQTAQAVPVPSALANPSPLTGADPRVVAEAQATPAEGDEGEGGNDNTSPAPESAPPKSPPTAPPTITETELANSAVPVPLPKQNVPRTPPIHSERTAYNHIPSASNPLNRIRPPMAVQVQEFQPKLATPPAAVRKRETSSGPDVPLLTTLSYQFQTMVPKMSVNAQLYSKQPAERFVVINMKRYAEGQQTAEGVTVEAIRQEDIIFSYQGQRFRLSR